MLQIFTEDSAIYQQTENAKTNNNIVGHYLVNHCEICIDVYVYRSPPPKKGPSYYPQNITLQFYIYYHKNYYAY